MNYQEWLENKDLKYEDNALHYGNVNTIHIAKKYGTPVYLINEDIIRKRYSNLKNLLNSEIQNNSIHYAVKANSNLSVLKILNSEGAAVDCTSKGEIFLCLKAGFSKEKIMYTGNMFTNQDFEYAIENDIFINLDSVSQLERLTNIYDKLNKKKKRISFRINPEFGAGHHKHTITAGKDIKFGILEHQVVDAYSKARDMGFQEFGIHSHIGSGILDAEDYKKAIEKYLNIVLKLADSLNLPYEFIDFGGGLGIPYKPDQEPMDLQRYKEVVILPFKQLVEQNDLGDPEFRIEPGRFIVGEASILLAQINTIKDNGYKKFAGLDAGFNTLVRPTMYGSYHHIITCREERKGKQFEYDIVGPICESGDILGKSREMSVLNEGDYLAILDTGAYGFNMASVYNTRPRPPEILINDKKTYIVRKRETIEDLIEKQSIASHLK